MKRKIRKLLYMLKKNNNTKLLFGLAAIVVLILVVAGVFAVSLFGGGEHGVVKVDSARVGGAAGGEADAGNSGGEAGTGSSNSEVGITSSNAQDSKKIYVHMDGCVANPGVYALDEGARVQDALNSAGGFSEGAYTSGINLARKVVDGEQIVVKSMQEHDELLASGAGVGVSNAGSSAPGTGAGAGGGAPSALVNINTATIEMLDTLPGIGESTAAKIISDRDKNGPFEAIEDIQRVSGIGESKFENLKDMICV